MQQLFTAILLSLTLLTSCFYPQKGRVIPQCRMYWKDTLRYDGEERKLLKTYFDLVLAFENKDTAKVMAMSTDSIYCPDCHDWKKEKKNDSNNYSKKEYFSAGFPIPFYWTNTHAEVITGNDTDFQVFIKNNCRGEECSTIILNFIKMNKNFKYSGYTSN